MDTNSPTRSSGWFANRTRLVTVASVVAVGAAGAVAFGANLGLLDSAGAGAVGTATAAELAPTTSRVVDVYLPASTTTTAPPTVPAAAASDGATAVPAAATSAVEEFEVDVAGTVWVHRDGDSVRLDRVLPAAGWSWSLRQTEPSALVVTLTNGVRTFEFSASIAADGTIAASVNEPVAATPAPAPAPARAGEDDDDHHEDEHEEHEYEGGDEDD